MLAPPLEDDPGCWAAAPWLRVSDGSAMITAAVAAVSASRQARRAAPSPEAATKPSTSSSTPRYAAASSNTPRGVQAPVSRARERGAAKMLIRAGLIARRHHQRLWESLPSSPRGARGEPGPRNIQPTATAGRAPCSAFATRRPRPSVTVPTRSGLERPNGSASYTRAIRRASNGICNRQAGAMPPGYGTSPG